MNRYGWLGLLFVWIAGRYCTDIITFWCSGITAVVFFIASVAQWIHGVTDVDNDDYD